MFDGMKKHTHLVCFRRGGALGWQCCLLFAPAWLDLSVAIFVLPRLLLSRIVADVLTKCGGIGLNWFLLWRRERFLSYMSSRPLLTIVLSSSSFS